MRVADEAEEPCPKGHLAALDVDMSKATASFIVDLLSG